MRGVKLFIKNASAGVQHEFPHEACVGPNKYTIHFARGIQGPPGAGVDTYEQLLAAFDLIPPHATRAEALTAGHRLFKYSPDTDEGLAPTVVILPP